MGPPLAPGEHRHESITIPAVRVPSLVEVKADEPEVVVNAPQSLPKALYGAQRGSNACFLGESRKASEGRRHRSGP